MSVRGTVGGPRYEALHAVVLAQGARLDSYGLRLNRRYPCPAANSAPLPQRPGEPRRLPDSAARAGARAGGALAERPMGHPGMFRADSL